MTRVAIVIVTYNSALEIAGCLESLHAAPDAEVVVVDNASSDGTQDIVRRHGTRLIANPSNAGFAGGVNLGVRATSAPLILLLNPDAHLRTDLDAMTAHFGDARVGIVGGMLTDNHGRPQTGFMIRNLPTPTALAFEVLGINRLWPGNPVNWHYRCMDQDPMAPGPAQQPAGAFLMFSRDTWLQVGGFDERFTPVWFEDVDFCAQVLKNGLRILYEPRVVARHTGGHSVNTIHVANRYKYWYGNLLGYASSHFGIISFRVVCVAVALGALLRAIGGWVRGSSGAFQMYGVVFRLAFVRLLSRRGLGRLPERQQGVKSGRRENQ